MKVLIVLLAVALVGEISAMIIHGANEKPEAALPEVPDAPKSEELVVASLLSVKSKPRAKRQFGGFGQSSALANANSFGQYSGPGGFGASSGIAGAQAFQSQSPHGGFGASATNAGTQGFHAGPGGFSGSAGMSGTQTYNLPNGQNVNLAYGGSFSNNNGQGSGSSSHGITYTK